MVSSFFFYAFGQLGLTPTFSLKESCAFGAFISSTDPVAVLAIFKELNADVTLFSLIFGESIFNDAIAIVMYRSFSEINSEEHFAKEVFQSLGQFFIVFFGSVLIGAFAALLIALILKRQGVQNREQADFEAQRAKNQPHNLQIQEAAGGAQRPEHSA